MHTYDEDLVAWTEEQVALLREGHLDALDRENIIEEIESLGKSQQRELSSRMVVLFAHLLKWQFQPDLRGASWRSTIRVQRAGIQDVLDDSPSLKRHFDDATWMAKRWRHGVEQAVIETGLPRVDFPTICPWTLDQVLDDDFLPD
jgi:hypothetical protein